MFFYHLNSNCLWRINKGEGPLKHSRANDVHCSLKTEDSSLRETISGTIKYHKHE
jgi:hypothetical protein